MWEWGGLYLKAMGIGLAIAAPVGPMSLLCMRRTLSRGWRAGMATGWGIATGDGIYASVAALGLAGVSRFMLAHERPLHAAAALFLIYLGLRGVFRRAGGTSAQDAGGGRWSAAYGSAVLLTLTNPPTIIMFAAVFAALAPAGGFGWGSAVPTVLGVFSGSILWWLGLTALLARARHAIGPGARHWIDRIAGGLLALLGATELRRAV